MKFENIEKFRAFLDENLKNHLTYNFNAFVGDFERQIEETGVERYELSGSKTVSGWPEGISFERIDKFIIDGKEVPPCDDFDSIETTIIF